MANTKPKPFVFVLMPFSNEFDDVYELGITGACKEVGVHCERVDEQIFKENILARIYNQIDKADMIVADMTGQNPNVFYEVGYAHALDKKVILLTRDAKDIPFDLKHFAHIVYSDGITRLKETLKKRLRYFIEHPEEKRIASAESLKYYINGEDVSNNGSLHVDLPNFKIAQNGHPYFEDWILSFGVHNPSDAVVKISEMQFGFVFPSRLSLPSPSASSFVKLPNDHFMYLERAAYETILPGGWFMRSIRLRNEEPRSVSGQLFYCYVKVFTELGTVEKPFHIWVK